MCMKGIMMMEMTLAALALAAPPDAEALCGRGRASFNAQKRQMPRDIQLIRWKP